MKRNTFARLLSACRVEILSAITISLLLSFSLPPPLSGQDCPVDQGLVVPYGPQFFIARYDHYIYYNCGVFLKIVDISNPYLPVEVNHIHLQATGRLCVGGSTLFVVTYDGILYAHDLSDPLNPVEVGYLDIGDTVSSVLYANETLFVTASDNNALYAVDVSDPANPSLITSLFSGYSGKGMTIQFDTLYLSADENGTGHLILLDISDPSAIAVWSDMTGVIATPALAVYGRYLYLVGSYYGMSPSLIYDVSNPSAPAWIANFDNVFVPIQAGIDGTTLFILGATSTITIYNLTRPDTPALLSKTYYCDWGTSIILINHFLYFPTLIGGCYGVTIRNPADPVVVWRDRHSHIRSLDTMGDTLIVHVSSAGFDFLSLANPLSPTRIGAEEEACGHSSFISAREGNLLFTVMIDWSQPSEKYLLKVLDVQNPSNPRRLSLTNVTWMNDPYSIAVSNDLVAIGAGYEHVISLMDVHDPVHPFFLNAFTVTAQIEGLVMRGSTLYCVEDGLGVEIYDLSDPSSPAFESLIPYANEINDLIVHRNLLLIATDPDGLVIYDVSDPSAPAHIVTYSALGWLMEVYVYGDLAFVSAEGYHSYILNIADPSSPTVLGTLHGYSFTVYDHYLYLQYGALGVYDIAGCVNDCFYYLGDVNFNGAVSSMDASLTLQSVVGLIDLTPQEACRADVNMNGSVTAYDAALTLACTVGQCDILPSYLYESCRTHGNCP